MVRPSLISPCISTPLLSNYTLLSLQFSGELIGKAAVQCKAEHVTGGQKTEPLVQTTAVSSALTLGVRPRGLFIREDGFLKWEGRERLLCLFFREGLSECLRQVESMSFVGEQTPLLQI